MPATKHARRAPPMTMTLSLRTLMFFMAAVTATLALFTPSRPMLATYAAAIHVFCMVVLLVLVCATFASTADDLWEDPEYTFVAGILGFLGFSAVIMFGMMVPTMVY